MNIEKQIQEILDRHPMNQESYEARKYDLMKIVELTYKEAVVNTKLKALDIIHDIDSININFYQSRIKSEIHDIKFEEVKPDGL